MFPKIQDYKTTSSPFFAFSQPLSTKGFEVETKMISTYTARTMRKYIDLKPVRDSAFTKAIRNAIEEIAEAFPSYSVFSVLRSAEVYSDGDSIPETLSMFRLSVSRNDDTRKVFLNVQLKYETPRLIKAELESRIPVLDISSESVSLTDEEDIDGSPVRTSRRNRV